MLFVAMKAVGIMYEYEVLDWPTVIEGLNVPFFMNVPSLEAHPVVPPEPPVVPPVPAAVTVNGMFVFVYVVPVCGTMLTPNV
jgi:hypothetical protein